MRGFPAAIGRPGGPGGWRRLPFNARGTRHQAPNDLLPGLAAGPPLTPSSIRALEAGLTAVSATTWPGRRRDGRGPPA